MIVTKVVNVSWNPRNKKIYEELGYKFTKIGDKFLIPIKHLPKGSQIKVEVKCDYCGLIKKIAYRTYLTQNKMDIVNKYSCNKCKGKKISESNLISYGVTNVSKVSEIRSEIDLKLRKDFSDIQKEFSNRGLVLLTKESDYQGACNTLLCFKCIKHENLGEQVVISYSNFIRGTDCYSCYKESISNSNNYNWKGGITPLANYVRDNLWDWKNETLKHCGYKCVVTGKRDNLVIHHLYNFNNILRETLSILGLDIKSSISEYSNDELFSMVSKCQELHFKYGLGVSLTNEVHKLFHKTYGRTNNTPEQFYEFKNKLV